jgi:membrane protein
MGRQVIDRGMNSVPGRTVRKFLEDNAPNWAALIAWNGLFAMFPIVLFAAAILGFVLSDFGTANSRVYGLIFSAAPGDMQLALVQAVEGAKTASGPLFVVGLLGMLWGGSNLFGMMEQAFAVIYHTRQRDFIRQKLIAFGMVFLFTILAGLGVASSSLLPALKNIPYLPSFLYSPTAAYIVQIIVGIVAGLILFTTIYYVIPNRKQQLRKVLPGALLAGVLFEVVTQLFPLYVTLNKGLNQYGKTFGLIFLLMTFFFFLGLITMLGVELNSIIYPVPVELPGKDAHAVAPAQSGPQAERRRRPAMQAQLDSAASSSNGQSAIGRKGIPARAALGMAVVASVVGVILGRRSAGGD